MNIIVKQEDISVARYERDRDDKLAHPLRKALSRHLRVQPRCLQISRDRVYVFDPISSEARLIIPLPARALLAHQEWQNRIEIEPFSFTLELTERDVKTLSQLQELTYAA